MAIIKTRKVKLPSGTRRKTSNTRIYRKRKPSIVTLEAAVDGSGAITLVFRRYRPKLRWVVPAITVPLYWFDIEMLRRKLITSVPPDVLLADGRRFKVLRQETRRAGPRSRYQYTRWLVYEEHPLLPDKGQP